MSQQFVRSRHFVVACAYLAAVALVLASAVGCSGEESEPDAATDTSQTDASDVDESDSDASSGLTCENLQAEWSQFVDENSACEVDDDCTLVSDWSSCDCSTSLTGGGVGLNASASEDAQRYLDKAQSDECSDAFRRCDAAPSDNLRCEDGTCVVDSNSCISADAGG